MYRLRRVPAWGWALLFSVLLCLPRLGAFGLWEPWELNVADRARKLADRGVGMGALFEAITSAQLTPHLQGLGIALLGANEWGARIFGALAGIAGLMAVYWAGVGIFRVRAALIAVVALGTTPLFALSSRQMTSNVPLVAALALTLGAWARWVWPASGERRPRDLWLGALGLLLSFGTGGALVGVVVPCLAVVLSVVIGRTLRVQAPSWSPTEPGADDKPDDKPDHKPDDRPNDGTEDLAAWGSGRDIAPGLPFGASLRKKPIVMVALCALGVMGAALLIAALGKSIAGKPSALLGGIPRAGTPTMTFEYLVRQLGFGLFPWSAVAFFALGRPLIRLDDDDDDEADDKAERSDGEKSNDDNRGERDRGGERTNRRLVFRPDVSAALRGDGVRAWHCSGADVG